MNIKGDLLIRGGMVIDPERNFVEKADVLIKDSQIVDTSSSGHLEANKVIDATNHLVLPGLIDYHTHVYHDGTQIGIHPDSGLLPLGVTTAIDQGSTGYLNFESFFESVIRKSQIRIFAHLNVSPAGLATLTHSLEPVDPKLFNFDKIRSLFEKYSPYLLGLKIRQSAEIVGDLGIEPLKQTIKMAEEINQRVAVHTTNAPGNIDDLVSVLRSGDVFVHVFQGRGNHIISKSGEVSHAVCEARERGVLFDTADGRGHYAFSVGRTALEKGFQPDIISTDIVKGSLFDNSVFGLPLIMSKYLTMGINIENIVKACTAIPADLIGMKGKLGTLAPGAYADVSIFELKNMPFIMKDVFGEELRLEQIFIPRMTVLNGKIAFRSLEF